MEPSLATLLIVMVGAIAVIGLAIAITAPVGALVGADNWSVISVFHGLGATAFLLGTTIAVYLAWRLYIGEIRAFKDLKTLSAFSTVMAGVTIAFGNWIYIWYRGPGGDKSYFLTHNMSAIHEVFFEFKEFIALFTLPMLLVGTFLLWKYGEGIVHDKELRAVASISILLGWVYLLVAYVLGASITKLAGGA